MFNKKRIYLDFASITPMDNRVEKVMKMTSKSFANPSALYREGVEAKKILEKSRKDIAGFLSALSDEIIFTSGGTEGNNLAIFGAYFRAWEFLGASGKMPHLIVSSIEHSSVLECAKYLEKRGASITYIDPDEEGIIDAKKIREALRPETFLVSVQYANNEIGTIQPIAEIAKAIRHFKKNQDTPKSPYPLLHTDACQAPNYLDINVLTLHADLLTLDGSKIYGPRGTGVLFKKRGVEIETLMHGGGQEMGFRSGTENISNIAGFAEALKISHDKRSLEASRLSELQNYFLDKLKSEIPEAKINGSLLNRLPNNINFCVPGLDAEFAVFQFDSYGVAISSASSCLNRNEDSASYVVRAIDGNGGCSSSSLRVSFGRSTKKQDIDSFFRVWQKIKKIKI